MSQRCRHSIIPTSFCLAFVIIMTNSLAYGEEGYQLAGSSRRTADVLEAIEFVDENGFRFVAYRVQTETGSSIIISDTLAKTNFKKGDKIPYMEFKMESGESKLLSYSVDYKPEATSGVE